MAVNLDILSTVYFFADLPVEYKIGNRIIHIYPVTVKDSPFFLTSVDILTIDKNSSSNPEDISMSYLQFICTRLLGEDVFRQKFVNLLSLCLHWDKPSLKMDERGKFILANNAGTEDEIQITAKKFDEIKQIILYQNILDYDDSYINPDLKKAMDEQDAVKMNQMDLPNLERKMALITAHSGVLKKDQLEMTLRAHTMLFKEICGEVEFITVRPAALAAGKGNEIDHWIYKKKKDKFDGYITSADKYAKSMGGDGSNINSLPSAGSVGQNLDAQYNNFKNK